MPEYIHEFIRGPLDGATLKCTVRIGSLRILCEEQIEPSNPKLTVTGRHRYEVDYIEDLGDAEYRRLVLAEQEDE